MAHPIQGGNLDRKGIAKHSGLLVEMREIIKPFGQVDEKSTLALVKAFVHGKEKEWHLKAQKGEYVVKISGQLRAMLKDVQANVTRNAGRPQPPAWLQPFVGTAEASDDTKMPGQDAESETTAECAGGEAATEETKGGKAVEGAHTVLVPRWDEELQVFGGTWEYGITALANRHPMRRAIDRTCDDIILPPLAPKVAVRQDVTGKLPAEQSSSVVANSKGEVVATWDDGFKWVVPGLNADEWMKKASGVAPSAKAVAKAAKAAKAAAARRSATAAKASTTGEAATAKDASVTVPVPLDTGDEKAFTLIVEEDGTKVSVHPCSRHEKNSFIFWHFYEYPENKSKKSQKLELKIKDGIDEVAAKEWLVAQVTRFAKGETTMKKINEAKQQWLQEQLGSSGAGAAAAQVQPSSGAGAAAPAAKQEPAREKRKKTDGKSASKRAKPLPTGNTEMVDPQITKHHALQGGGEVDEGGWAGQWAGGQTQTLGAPRMHSTRPSWTNWRMSWRSWKLRRLRASPPRVVRAPLRRGRRASRPAHVHRQPA